MTPIVEDSILGSSLDCSGFQILNPGNVEPVPPPAVSTDDPSMTGARAVLNGSVTDLSVNAVAAIAQAKLNLTGAIPAAWLGTGPGQAAQGNLAELVSRKGQPNGYASLDSNGRLPSSAVAAGGAAGTVSQIGLQMPKEFSVANSPLKVAGTLAVTFSPAPATSWFGADTDISVTSPGGLFPSFKTTDIPLPLIPNLDGSKFGSGVFPVSMLPVAVGVGSASHAKGLVPDPGDKGDSNNYLGRDMQWRSFGQVLTYQPTCASPLISMGPPAPSPGSYHVNVSTVKGNLLFYRVNGGAFAEAAVFNLNLILQLNDFVEAYAAKAGWNNSSISSLTVLTPSP